MLSYVYFNYISPKACIKPLKEVNMNHYEKLKQLVLGAEDDFSKFYEKGNSVAGTRVRKSMQDLKVLAQEIRNDVQEIKNNK